MFEKPISKDSYNVLCIIYKIYLDRRNQGLSKSEAIMFDDPDNLINEYSIKINSDDFRYALKELKENGYLKLYIDDSFELNNDAVVFMENRFKKGISEVLDVVSKFF